MFNEDFQRNALMNLETLSILKSRLDSIQESGALSGSLKNLETRLRELKVNFWLNLQHFLITFSQIDDSRTSSKRLVKKMQTLIETVKLILDPIFAIADNVLKLSKGTSFSSVDSARILLCQDTWRRSRALFKSFLADFKQILSPLPGTVISNSLVDSLKNLHPLIESLLAEILLLSDVHEASSSEPVPIPIAAENNISSSDMKNVTAMNVLLKLKSKLEGRIVLGERTTAMSVDDQVDELIAMAVNPENLCQMYEGWMSWI